MTENRVSFYVKGVQYDKMWNLASAFAFKLPVTFSPLTVCNFKNINNHLRRCLPNDRIDYHLWCGESFCTKPLRNWKTFHYLHDFHVRLTDTDAAEWMKFILHAVHLVQRFTKNQTQNDTNLPGPVWHHDGRRVPEKRSLFCYFWFPKKRCFTGMIVENDTWGNLNSFQWFSDFFSPRA